MRIFVTLLVLGVLGFISTAAYVKAKDGCPSDTYKLEDGKEYYSVPVVTVAGKFDKLDVEVDAGNQRMVVCVEVAGVGRPEDRTSRLACLVKDTKTNKASQVIIPFKREQHT